MGFKTLQEVRAYQAARAFKQEIYRLVKVHPPAGADRRFRDQLFAAAASVEINLAEGFGRYSAKEFAHFARIARGSLEESSAWLRDGIDRGYFTAEACRAAFDLADRTARLLTGLIVSLRRLTNPRPGKSSPIGRADE
jgi:four helix bundle protein